MIDEERLSEVIREDVSLRLVEPHVYSVDAPGENVNSYDKWFGTFYDLVACNRFYNRLVWGYWTGEYHGLLRDALDSSNDGWVLDAGCGSLAFTAKTYAGYSGRPVVCLDQSIKLLKLAKSRLVKLGGRVPANIVFLHGDALQLPFRPKSFGTVVSLNLLHVVEEAEKLLVELKNALADGGTMWLTTLIEKHRLADRYLRLCARAGEVVPRTADQVFGVFEAVGMAVECRIRGNMAFIYHR